MDEQNLTVLELVRTVRLLQQQVEALTGESHLIKLRGEQPSEIVALKKIHPNSRYFVHTEVLEVKDGNIGEILISQRHRNGFLLSYTGTAEEIVVDVWVQDRPELREA